MIDVKIILDALMQQYQKGKTYQEIAKSGGLSYSYLHEIMTGKRPADGISVKKLNGLFPQCVLFLEGDSVSIDAPRNSGNVVGVNNGGVIGGSMEPAIDKILASEELSDSEKIKVLKVLKK